MPLRELLDELLTSLETGPLISAYRHFDARPAVYAPFPSSLPAAPRTSRQQRVAEQPPDRHDVAQRQRPCSSICVLPSRGPRSRGAAERSASASRRVLGEDYGSGRRRPGARL